MPNVETSATALTSSSVAVRDKKDSDRMHPDDFHKIKLL